MTREQVPKGSSCPCKWISCWQLTAYTATAVMEGMGIFRTRVTKMIGSISNHCYERSRVLDT